MKLETAACNNSLISCSLLIKSIISHNKQKPLPYYGDYGDDDHDGDHDDQNDDDQIVLHFLDYRVSWKLTCNTNQSVYDMRIVQ